MKKFDRIHWVDALRGTSILMMIVFHFAYDLDFFGLAKFDFRSIGWMTFARLIEFGFFGLAGFSLHLSHRHSGNRPFLAKQLNRFTILFLSSLLITVVTAILFPGQAIWFGTLHLIAFSVLIGAFLIRFPRITLYSAIPILLTGAWFADLHPTFPWLTPLGITPDTYASLDYFPLFPWLAVPLLGLSLAHSLDHHKLLNPSKKPIRIRPLEYCGRHSLLIYLIHQPLLFGGLWLLLRFR